MAKKIIIASSGLGCLFCIGLIIFALAATAVTIDPAQLESAKQNVISLINSGQYAEALDAVDKMIVDFNKGPGLPDALYPVAERFGWQKRYAEAKEIFEGLIADYPTSNLADDARLYSARMSACVLAKANKNEELLVAVDNLISGFAGNSNVAEAIYWIGKQREWSSVELPDKATRYLTPLSIYQRLIERFPESIFAEQAALAVRQLSHRTRIFTLMKEGEQGAIDSAIADMAADFKDSPEFVSELYWCACEYEEYPDKNEQRLKLYEFIREQFPQSTEADQITLDIPRMEILGLIRAGEVNQAQVALNEFIADYNQHTYAGACISMIAAGYYTSYTGAIEQNQWDMARQYFERAAGVWQYMIDNDIQSDRDVVYYYAALNRQKHGQWEGAIEYYQKVVENWPDFEHICAAKAGIGWCYEILRNEGKLTKEEINPFIEQVYMDVLEEYPDCYVGDYVAYRLGELNLEKGDTVNAALYYRKFLELAKPGDMRIEDVNEKLEKLEGKS